MPLITDFNPIKIDIQPLQFVGLNKKEVIQDDQISDGINLSSEAIPKIKTRLPREDLGYSLSDPQDLFSAGGKLAWVDGTDFYYNGVNKGAVTAGKKSMVDFNGHIVIFPDKKYYCYDTDNDDYDTFDSFTAPDLDFITTHFNRVFGCKGDDVRGSKWGDFKEWEDFSGEEDDSWATDTGTSGDFIGIVTFQDHVTFFKSDYMTELYGMYPSQFSLVEVGKFGLVDQRAVAQGGGYLMFVDREGVKQYTGGVPRLMSDELNDKYVDSALASDGLRFYLFNDNGTDKKLYAFDLRTRSWMPEDDLDIVAFTEMERKVYALDSSGKIWKFNSGEETINWEFTTKNYDLNSFFKKNVRKVKLRIVMEDDAEVSVFLKKNMGNFELVDTYENTDSSKYKEMYSLINLNRVDYFQIKVEGTGTCTVNGFIEYSLRSDKRIN